jgi:hypothetical protein
LYKLNEAVQKARMERKRLIDRAAKGDKKAQEILSKPPYFMRVYSQQEKAEYEQEKQEENNEKSPRVDRVKKPKVAKRKKK